MLLEHARRREYISSEKESELEKDAQEIIKMIIGYMKKLKNELQEQE